MSMLTLSTLHSEHTLSPPPGKMFTEEELELIGGVCAKHNVIIVTDEVYERVVFQGSKHVRIASLPGR